MVAVTRDRRKRMEEQRKKRFQAAKQKKIDSILMKKGVDRHDMEIRKLRRPKVRNKFENFSCYFKESNTSVDNPRIICLMAAHGRPGITTETVKMLKKQTVPIAVLIVGDSDVEREIAKNTGCLYLQHKNNPLGEKWQAGVNCLREFDFDALMICGSDSWITPNWCEIAIPILDKGTDLVGITTFHACKIYPNEKVRIIRRAYKNERAQTPMGSGRIFSVKFLKSINWKLFPLKKEKGMDGHSFKKLKRAGGKSTIMTDSSLKVLSIKSTWESLNSWDKYIMSKKNKVLPDIKTPKEWLANNFPGSIEALDRVVNNIVW